MNDAGAQAKATGTGARTVAVLIVAAVVFGLFLTLTQSDDPAPADLVAGGGQGQTTPVAERAAPAPDQAQSEEQNSAAPAGADTVDDAPQIRPTVDEIRLESDGLTVIAGRAEPGAQVSVRIDGEEVATAVADTRGAFAAVGFVSPSDAARVLTLSASGVLSDEDVILAPVVAPVADVPAPPADVAAPLVAEVEPDVPEETRAPGTEDLVQSEAVEGEAARVPQTTPATIGDAEPAPQSQTEAIAALRAQTEDVAPPTVGPAPQSVPVPEGATPAVPTVEPTAEAPTAEAVTVLKSTADGVEVLQPAPEVTTSVAIDTIGYSEQGDVQLSGRAVIGTSEVRVYLDNRFATSLPVDTDGDWRGDLPEVDVGRYRLRVDQVNSAGDVTSRVETPFQREAPAALAAADTSSDAGPVRAVTVQTGDTLWAIARDRYGEGVLYVKVVAANRGNIRDPDLIYPGQVFDLPVE